jgi:hypothetical protein
MRNLSALILSAGLATSLSATPPVQDATTGPPATLTPAQAKRLKDQAPRTGPGVTRLVGPPVRVYRHPDLPENEVWEYRVAGPDPILLAFKRGRVVDAIFPKD